MLIVCPRCETTFSLPDALFKPEKKARCSHCGLVFPMAAAQAPPQPEAEKAPAPKEPPADSQKVKPSFFVRWRKALVGGAALLLLLALGYGLWLTYSSYKDDPAKPSTAETQPGQDAEAQAQAEVERLSGSVSLDEIRQFQVDNTQIGKITVIQGVAVNISKTNKDFVIIEARLLDANGKTLGEPVQQLCGVPLTLFQLQSLSGEELKSTLNNRITILTYNTNIAPGGKVPFVVVFPSPPAAMKKFEVRVIGVQEAAAS